MLKLYTYCSRNHFPYSYRTIVTISLWLDKQKCFYQNQSTCEVKNTHTQLLRKHTSLQQNKRVQTRTKIQQHRSTTMNRKAGKEGCARIFRRRYIRGIKRRGIVWRSPPGGSFARLYSRGGTDNIELFRVTTFTEIPWIIHSGPLNYLMLYIAVYWHLEILFSRILCIHGLRAYFSSIFYFSEESVLNNLWNVWNINYKSLRSYVYLRDKRDIKVSLIWFYSDYKN